MVSTKGIKAGRAYVELGVSDKLTAGLRRAQRRLKAFGAAVTGIGLKILGVGAVMGAAMGGAAKSFMSLGDQIAKMAKRTGFSVEALSGLRYAASQSGTSIEGLETGLRRMQRSIYDASRGLSTQTDALRDMGLAYQDLEGLSPEDQFIKLADAMSRLEDKTTQSALAQAFFGRAGTLLIPMMADGAAGIDKLMKKARDLGLIMSAEDAVAAEEATDAFDSLGKTLRMAIFYVGAAIAPTLKRLAERVTRVSVAVGAWISQNRGLIVSVLKITGIVLAAGAALVAIGVTISIVGSALGLLAGIIHGAAAAFAVLAAVMGAMLSPIGIIAAAVIGLGVGIATSTGAGGKALAWLGERFSALAETARETWKAITDALKAGDLALAGKIALLGLKKVWYEQTAGLRKFWSDTWFGIRADHEVAVHGMTIAMIEGTTLMSKAFARLKTDTSAIWETIGYGARVMWAGIVADIYDISKADLLAEIETDHMSKMAQIEGERRRAMTEAQGTHDAMRAEAKRTHDEQMVDLVAENAARKAGIEADIKAADEQLAAARKLAAAKAKTAAAEGEGAGIGEVPTFDAKQVAAEMKAAGEELAAKIAGGVAKAVQQLSVRGTFYAAAVGGLGGETAADRTARATAETAKNTKEITRRQLDNVLLWGGF